MRACIKTVSEIKFFETVKIVALRELVPGWAPPTCTPHICDSMRVDLKYGCDSLFVDQHTDRAMRSGMEPVVNSTVKMLGTGWAPRATG
jgi:hypothetical protein